MNNQDNKEGTNWKIYINPEALRRLVTPPVSPTNERVEARFSNINRSSLPEQIVKIS